MAALSEAEAGLTINFDPNSNEVFFSGEDSGTPDVSTAFAETPNGGLTSVFVFDITFGNFLLGETFSFQIPTDSSALTADGAGIPGTFTSVSGEGSGISLGLSLENGDLLTITGDEDVRFDISSAGEDTLAFLASLNGTTVSRLAPIETDFFIVGGEITPTETALVGKPSASTGFEELHVNVLPVAAVPEPAAATLLALTGLTLSCRRRRRS